MGRVAGLVAWLRLRGMRNGRIVELARAAQIFAAAQHAGTRILPSAMPCADPDAVMNFSGGEGLAKLDAEG